MSTPAIKGLGPEPMVTMAIAFVLYLAIIGPLTDRYGLAGLWSAVLVFMAARGIAQALWMPRLMRRLEH